MFICAIVAFLQGACHLSSCLQYDYVADIGVLSPEVMWLINRSGQADMFSELRRILH